MQKENGVCFGCGKETNGTPAKADWIISGARKFRSLLSLPKKQTVACTACMPSLREKREKFEKSQGAYRIGAAAVFLVLILLSALAKSIDAGMVLSAAAAALFIWLLSFFRYSPKFD